MTAIYKGLTAKDLDMLVTAAIDDFDLWGYYYGDGSDLDKYIERVADARKQISLETGNIKEELEPDYVEDDCFDDEEVDSDETGDDSLAGEENYE